MVLLHSPVQRSGNTPAMRLVDRRFESRRISAKTVVRATVHVRTAHEPVRFPAYEPFLQKNTGASTYGSWAVFKMELIITRSAVIRETVLEIIIEIIR